MKYRSWEEIWQSHNALTSLQGDQLLLIKADVLASQIHVEKCGTAMLVTDSWKTKSSWLCGCLSPTSVNYRLMYLHWLLISLLTMLQFPNLFKVASGLGLASARDQGSVKNHGADTCPEWHALSPPFKHGWSKPFFPISLASTEAEWFPQHQHSADLPRRWSTKVPKSQTLQPLSAWGHTGEVQILTAEPKLASKRRVKGHAPGNIKPSSGTAYWVVSYVLHTASTFFSPLHICSPFIFIVTCPFWYT